MKVSSFSSITIKNFIFLTICLIWNCNGDSRIQAVDDSFSIRVQSSSSCIRIGSDKNVPSSVERHNRIKAIERCKTNRPCIAPSSPPTAAPTDAPSSFTDTQSDRDEHNAWLLQQERYTQQQQYGTFPTDSVSISATTKHRKRGKGLFPSFLSGKSLEAASLSFLSASKAYAERVYHESPTTFWTTSSSIVIFICWNFIPIMRPILMKFFLASRQSAKGSLGLSLVFSAISHTSFRHLLVNLLVFLNLSPALTAIKVPSSSWASKTSLLGSSSSSSSLQQYAGLRNATLWPFLLGGALSGNLLFLLFRPLGSCLGLSGVTCAMLGAYAAAVPDRVMKIRVYGVIPVSLRTGTLVQVLLVVSLVGSIFMPSSPICHLGHLGGLLFGLLYYQNVMITGSKTKFVFGR